MEIIFQIFTKRIILISELILISDKNLFSPKKSNLIKVMRFQQVEMIIHMDIILISLSPKCQNPIRNEGIPDHKQLWEIIEG